MDYLDIFKMARERPRMLGLDGSFAAASAFVAGCDAGNSWRLLDGFSEWLAMNLGDGVNLSWQALVVRHAALGERVKSPGDISGNEENSAAVEVLFDLLVEFWNVRQEIGLAEIFAKHAEIFGGDR
ncbi:hypothetical protein [Lentzea kentuckyensis]|uniref:hypothetical protein n=1 Tax=Lentzea kentuckyensis TaxID=360086 RepID=UPI000A38CDE1|nr:hypothetical protein [Lentzea kentuckyensis]